MLPLLAARQPHKYSQCAQIELPRLALGVPKRLRAVCALRARPGPLDGPNARRTVGQPGRPHSCESDWHDRGANLPPVRAGLRLLGRGNGSADDSSL